MPEYNQAGANDPDFEAGKVEFGPLEEKLKPETAERVADYVDSVREQLASLAQETDTYVPVEDGIFILNNDKFNKASGRGGMYGAYGQTLILKNGDLRIMITEYGDERPEGMSKTRTLRTEGEQFKGAQDVYVWRQKDGRVNVEAMYGRQNIVEDGYAYTPDREVARIEDEIGSFLPVATPQT